MATDAHKVNGTPVSQDALGATAMKFLSGQFFRQARTDASLNLSVLTKVPLQNEANELWRETNALRRESLDFTRKRMKSAEKHWESDALETPRLLRPCCYRFNPLGGKAPADLQGMHPRDPPALVRQRAGAHRPEVASI